MYENDSYGTENEYSAEPAVTSEKARNNTGIGRKLIVFTLCGILFGAAASASFFGIKPMFKGGSAAEKNSPIASTELPVQSSSPDKNVDTGSVTANDIAKVTYPLTGSSPVLDVSTIAEGAMSSMVSITNISVQEVQSYFGLFGFSSPQTQERELSGTGIIIGTNETELLIVTNNHVIDKATTLSVCFVDNEVCAATTKGTDPDNDLAVIAVKLSDIKQSTSAAIKQAQVGSSDTLKVGQQVVAIGNALGYGQSVTTGIVSALNRRIDTTDAIMIQTDAAINPGNSGGALLNMNGELIGINSAKFSSTQVEGMGYAISITPATPIIEDLMNRTTREKVSSENASYLGINGEDITASISSAYGMPQGIYVTNVIPNSPAEAAGVRVKSIITRFDGIRVTSLSNLQSRMQYYSAGETVVITVEVLEGNEYIEKTLTVTLGRATDQQNQSGNGRFTRP